MPIFTSSCVLAELFLDGTAIFSFAQLLGYHKGEYSPNDELQRIPDENMRSLIKSMVALDPALRLPAREYLQQWYASITYQIPIFLPLHRLRTGNLRFRRFSILSFSSMWHR